MLTQLLDKLGEGNPQLVRELKGRLNPRSAGLVLLISAISQCVMVGVSSRRNCLGGSEEIVGGYCQQSERVIQWQFAFNSLSFMLPLLLFAGGVYLLSSDLMKEQGRRISAGDDVKFNLDL